MSKIVKDKQNLMLLICLGLVAVSYLFILSFFRYEDTVSFTAWSATFWDSLFSGNLGQYYTYAQSNLRGALHDTTSIEYLTFLPWIIWNFPVWALHPLSKNPDVTGMKCIIWSKLFMVACLVLLCIYVYKIMMKITNDDFTFSLASVVMVASSLEMIDSIAYAGQDEVVYLATLVIMLHQYIIGKKKSAFVFALLSVTFNPLMIIPVMVILVVVEKRILFILMHAVAYVLPTVLFKMVYSHDAVYQAAQPSYNNLGIFQAMMNTGTIGTTVGATPIAFVVLVLLVFAAFMGEVSEEKRAEILIYYFAVSFFALDFLTSALWYRYCMYVPFFVLLIGVSKENRNMKVFLLEVLFVSRFIASLSNYYNLSFAHISSIGSRLLGDVSGTVVDITGLTYDTMLYVLRPVIVAIGIILLVICHRKFDKEIKFSIPWKVVVYAGSLAGLVLCAWIVKAA